MVDKSYLRVVPLLAGLVVCLVDGTAAGVGLQDEFRNCLRKRFGAAELPDWESISIASIPRQSNSFENLCRPF